MVKWQLKYKENKDGWHVYDLFKDDQIALTAYSSVCDDFLNETALGRDRQVRCERR